jgi:hypothetical protein
MAFCFSVVLDYFSEFHLLAVPIDSILECFTDEAQKTQSDFPKRTVKIVWHDDCHEPKEELQMTREGLFATEVIFQSTEV